MLCSCFYPLHRTPRSLGTEDSKHNIRVVIALDPKATPYVRTNEMEMLAGHAETIRNERQIEHRSLVIAPHSSNFTHCIIACHNDGRFDRSRGKPMEVQAFLDHNIRITKR